MSLDAKLATHTGESKWITNEEARADARKLRHTHDAILVGIGTILADNPALTTRIAAGNNPLRVILDTHLQTPLVAQVVNDEVSPTWIFVGSSVAQEQIVKYQQFSQVKIIQMPTVTLNVLHILNELSQVGIKSILVEGGNKVISSFLQAKLLNRLVMYISPQLIGGNNAMSFFVGEGFSHLANTLKLKFEHIEWLGDNLKIVALAR